MFYIGNESLIHRKLLDNFLHLINNANMFITIINLTIILILLLYYFLQYNEITAIK